MTSPASRLRKAILVSTAVTGILAGSAIAQESTTPAAAPARKSAPKAQTPAPARSLSYSLGVSMGEQLHATGVSAESVNPAQLAQGVRDALGGKTTLTDADRTNIQKMLQNALTAQAEVNHKAAAKFLAENGKKPDVTTTASGLQYRVLAPGSGPSPKPTDEVTVNYSGKLLDGTEFDSSYKRGEPAKFILNRVIPGWTEGVGLMKAGSKYELFIPPALAYDTHSPTPTIPPGSLLIFTVELMSFKSPPPAAPAPAPKQ
ncbi:MAG: FKBP-type peptidyl-prolyl cis-trans isomerase [Proteobacteria bacterium]|nr:FKBP-type peptidyl-prolyl cis-trans isomerase [Pseudomonadota bacterium]